MDPAHEVGIFGPRVRAGIGGDAVAHRMPRGGPLAGHRARDVHEVLVVAAVCQMTVLGRAVDLQPLVVDVLPRLALGHHEAAGRLVPAEAIDVRVAEQALHDVGRLVHILHQILGQRLVGHRHIGHRGHPPERGDARNGAEDRIGGTPRLAHQFQIPGEDLRVAAVIGHARMEDVVLAHIREQGQRLAVRLRPVPAVLGQDGGVLRVVVQHGVEFAAGIVIGQRGRKGERQDPDGQGNGNRLPGPGGEGQRALVQPRRRVFRHLHGDPELLEPAGVQPEGLEGRGVRHGSRFSVERHVHGRRVADPDVGGARRIVDPQVVLLRRLVDPDQGLVVQQQFGRHLAARHVREIAVPGGAGLVPARHDLDIDAGGRNHARGRLQVRHLQLRLAGRLKREHEERGRLGFAAGGDEADGAAERAVLGIDCRQALHRAECRDGIPRGGGLRVQVGPQAHLPGDPGRQVGRRLRHDRALHEHTGNKRHFNDSPAFHFIPFQPIHSRSR